MVCIRSTHNTYHGLVLILLTGAVSPALFGETNGHGKHNYIKNNGQNCKRVADIIFAIDGSESVWDGDFLNMKDFVLRTIRHYEIDENLTHIGFMVFSSRIATLISLKPFKSLHELVHIIVKAQQPYEGTRLDLVLRNMHNMIKLHGRPGVPATGIILTDGFSQRNFHSTHYEANIAKRIYHMNILAIGFGKMLSRNLMNVIASTHDNIIRLSSSYDLFTLNISRNILTTSTCSEPVLQPPTVSSTTEFPTLPPTVVLTYPKYTTVGYWHHQNAGSASGDFYYQIRTRFPAKYPTTTDITFTTTTPATKTVPKTLRRLTIMQSAKTTTRPTTTAMTTRPTITTLGTTILPTTMTTRPTITTLGTTILPTTMTKRPTITTVGTTIFPTTMTTRPTTTKSATTTRPMPTIATRPTTTTPTTTRPLPTTTTRPRTTTPTTTRPTTTAPTTRPLPTIATTRPTTTTPTTTRPLPTTTRPTTTTPTTTRPLPTTTRPTTTTPATTRPLPTTRPTTTTPTTIRPLPTTTTRPTTTTPATTTTHPVSTTTTRPKTTIRLTMTKPTSITTTARPKTPKALLTMAEIQPKTPTKAAIAAIITRPKDPPKAIPRIDTNMNVHNIISDSEECRHVQFTDKIAYKPSSNHCTQFFMCIQEGDFITTHLASCPFPFIWDPTLNWCRSPMFRPCQADPCSMAPWGSTYSQPNNYRAFWKCTNKYSQPNCCPKGYAYSRKSRGCVKDSSCTDLCDANYNVPENGGCRMQEFLLDRRFYFEDLPHQGFMVRACPPTTLYDPLLCSCTWQPSLPGQYQSGIGKRECSPELYLNFDQNFRDQSGSNLAVTTQNVDRNKNTAEFAGQGSIKLWRYSGSSLGTKMAIKFKFLAKEVYRGTEFLIANCNMMYNPSLSISIDRQESMVQFAMLTDRDTVAVLRLGYDNSKWNEVSMIYTGLIFQIIVNGKTLSKEIKGGIQGRNDPLSFGSCHDSKGYNGFLDEIYVYQCIPSQLYLDILP